jgi:hypothetical protein
VSQLLGDPSSRPLPLGTSNSFVAYREAPWDHSGREVHLGAQVVAFGLAGEAGAYEQHEDLVGRSSRNDAGVEAP